MHEGNIYTCDITEEEIQPILIRQILQENVEEEFYITEDKKPKWVYLKGAKKIPRKTKDGHEYTFSEGPVAFPDPWDRPGRNSSSSAGASGVSSRQSTKGRSCTAPNRSCRSASKQRSKSPELQQKQTFCSPWGLTPWG